MASCVTDGFSLVAILGLVLHPRTWAGRAACTFCGLIACLDDSVQYLLLTGADQIAGAIDAVDVDPGAVAASHGRQGGTAAHCRRSDVPAIGDTSHRVVFKVHAMSATAWLATLFPADLAFMAPDPGFPVTAAYRQRVAGLRAARPAAAYVLMDIGGARAEPAQLEAARAFAVHLWAGARRRQLCRQTCVARTPRLLLSTMPGTGARAVIPVFGSRGDAGASAL